MALDHLVVTAADLDAGAGWVEANLGVPLAPGGRHPGMGTANRLLGLGPGLYLEVIAVDPGAAPPARPRWFGLDGPQDAPRLATWVARVPDLDASHATAPTGLAPPVPMRRGDLSWRIAAPQGDPAPFDGTFPALIAWDAGVPHPSARLADTGARLETLVLVHPRAAALKAALGAVTDPRLRIAAGPAPRLAARIATSGGTRWLGAPA